MQPPAVPNDPSCGGKTVLVDRKSPRKRIAFLGASVRAAAESASRAGFSVVGIDRFADQDTLSACERHLLLDDRTLGRDGRADQMAKAITEVSEEMSLIPVGGLLGHHPFLRELPLLQAWPGQSEAAEKVRKLDCLRAIARSTPFQVPPTFASVQLASASTDFPTQPRWLRKSLDSCGGLGTRWLSPDASAAANEVVQTWVPGRLFGATLLSNGSSVEILGVCRSLITRKSCFPFVYSGSFGPIGVTDSIWNGLQVMGDRVLSTTGLRGLFTIDFVADSSGPLWLLEINPRWSGSSELIERHLQRRQPNASLMSILIDSLNGSPMPSTTGVTMRPVDDDPRYLKRIVFARRDLRFDPARFQLLLQTHESLHDLPADGRWVRRGEPVCTLITQPTGKGKDPMRRHLVLLKQMSGLPIR